MNHNLADFSEPTNQKWKILRVRWQGGPPRLAARSNQATFYLRYKTFEAGTGGDCNYKDYLLQSTRSMADENERAKGWW